MDHSTLQLFSNQLAAWSESAIEHGRFPFRKVETFPELATNRGELRPPLVFWINRDSCMAGGVLVFPPGNGDNASEDGGACAGALGLKHFVSWAPREIVFWEIREKSVLRHKTIPLPDSSHPSRFRSALLTVMNELKVLSVLGAVAPEQLSAHYLANLCRGNRKAALPSLVEAYRIARSDERLAADALPADIAEHKAAMTLLRLLGLVMHDALPPTVQPEGLERAMAFALDSLPAHCRNALQPEEDELPLPAESAVVFHHLFRRLTQLRLQEDRQRTARLLELLLACDGERFGGSPLPGPDAGGRALLLNPDRPVSEKEAMVGAASPILACIALWRALKDLKPLSLQTASLSTLSPELAPTSVRGTLRDERTCTGQERRNLAARLRLSWPTRRFRLPTRTPAWLWELLHVLGIAAEGCRLELVTPDNWLTADFGIPLFEVLAEQFTLERLSAADGHVQFTMLKTREVGHAATLAGPEGERVLPWGENGLAHRSMLPLALNLPDDLFALLDRGVLLLPETVPEIDSRGLLLFSRSTLGRLLWKLVSGNRPLPPEERLSDEACRRGLPVPDAGILGSLRQIAPQDGTGLPPSRILDEELAPWLGGALQMPAANRIRAASPAPRPPQELPSAEEIAATVFVDGLPRFPEQYLYEYYRPQLVEYEFSGHLEEGDEFFGRHLLQDDSGKRLEVEGAETARALLLASFSGCSPIALPVDRQLTAAILDRYLADLGKLRRNLLRQTHLRIANGRAAEALAKKIWHSRPLPPWEMIENEPVI